MAEASIVFRNEDMSATGKIYVDDIVGAVELASRFRNASHWVDVINRLDEVAYRWEKGELEWQPGHLTIAHVVIEPYDFVRKGDGFWDAWNRMNELSHMIAFAFDVAVGNLEPHDQSCYLNLVAGPDWSLWTFVEEAEQVRKDAPRENAKAWTDFILDWMQNPEQLYLQYLTEYKALMIKTGELIHGCRVSRLEVELAEIDAYFMISSQSRNG